MFKKLLIANRGEVAVRIARAARELGIARVGVCSTADQGAAWLAHMDEVVCVGGPAPRESYLRSERIVQAALQTGASAVHPGWGFLAENARFAALCAQHGITFVGPSPRTMERMGLKSPAKAAMRAAGLDVIPGSDGLLRDVDEALAVAKRTGYPLILKPGQKSTWGELYVGSHTIFADAGFTEVSKPTPRRAVMRIDLWA